MSCAKIVIDEIVHRINIRIQPDGSPQKANAESTIKAKGHDHPLIGGSAESPLLAKASTYTRKIVGPSKVQIGIKPIRHRIAGYVEQKGYSFFDISPDAEEKVLKRWDQYVTSVIRKWFH